MVKSAFNENKVERIDGLLIVWLNISPTCMTVKASKSGLDRLLQTFLPGQYFWKWYMGDAVSSVW